MLRLGVCLNGGSGKGQAQATLLVPPVTDQIVEAAANKLRLKKKDLGRARAFVWRTGWELPRGAAADVLGSELQQGDLIAIALGEPYAGPCRPKAASVAGDTHGPAASDPSAATPGDGNGADGAPWFGADAPPPPPIRGRDDAGRLYATLGELHAEQAARRAEFYAANDRWWHEDGYGGDDDEHAMVGDGGTDADVEHSRALLERARAMRPLLRLGHALDGGAGVGRVTKHVLLRRCERVTVLEPCERWLKQSRRYLGHKRSTRCAFVCERLEAHEPPAAAYDLVWLQWCLQYLTDEDAVRALRGLARGVGPNGVIIVKENRPLRAPAAAEAASGGDTGGGDGGGSDGGGKAAADEFHVDTPEGPHARYDVTRPDAHHRWLFACAGLGVDHFEVWDETGAWVLSPGGGAAC